MPHNDRAISARSLLNRSNGEPVGLSAERSVGTAFFKDKTSRVAVDALVERIIAKDNVLAALQRVERNKGAAGPDGMAVNELRNHLKTDWPLLKAALLSGTYVPQPVRRVDIPKPDGGMRQLGIPNAIDRFIQQMLLQVLTPIFEPIFSEHSYGFRPGRSAHQAVQKAREYIEAGYGIVVDMDLSKFFDRVHHDKLMARVARHVRDKRVLVLIRRYLEAGILCNGVAITTTEGTPQGGPLSPLLANIMLDDLDRVLMRRGLRFCRYADDANIYVRSRKAGRRVMNAVRRFIERRLSLKINEEKSAVDTPRNRKFLGFSFFRRKERVLVRVASKSLKRFKDSVRTITDPHNAWSMEQRLTALNRYLRGWFNYFKLARTHSVYDELDGWLRRRLRLCLWLQWKRIRTRLRHLRSMGLDERNAQQAAFNSLGPWRMAGANTLNAVMNKTFWRAQGLRCLMDHYRALQC
jgi:group II intron reverse transcriptase/maturase